MGENTRSEQDIRKILEESSKRVELTALEPIVPPEIVKANIKKEKALIKKEKKKKNKEKSDSSNQV